MKEIYAAVGFDESASSTTEKESIFPKEYVKTSVQFSMKRALVELTEEAGKRDRIIVLNLDRFSVSTLLRDGSMAIRGNLESVSALEYHTLAGRELVAITSAAQVEQAAKFMQLQFDLNPIDCPTEQPLDMRVGMQSQPLAVTFSKSLIDRVAGFFSTEGSATGYQQISAAAYGGFDNLRQRAQNSIKYSLETKKKLAIGTL